MAIQTTYSNARANLSTLLDQVIEDLEIVVISWRGSEDVALAVMSRLESFLETVHLLSSPKNAQWLLTTLKRATSRRLKSQTMDRLRQETDLESKEQW
ncbi:MAG: type II toxin-antitoxin system Phd/YefM family antitoxin [Acidobacteriota bacterium]|nr:MAG: type II toxin-antitoxin system Phd/YefM family antitoxin [Acidobacteriota bacterium]